MMRADRAGRDEGIDSRFPGRAMSHELVEVIEHDTVTFTGLLVIGVPGDLLKSRKVVEGDGCTNGLVHATNRVVDIRVDA